MSPRFVLGRENVPCVAELVNRSLKADCTDFISKPDNLQKQNFFDQKAPFSHIIPYSATRAVATGVTRGTNAPLIILKEHFQYDKSRF